MTGSDATIGRSWSTWLLGTLIFLGSSCLVLDTWAASPMLPPDPPPALTLAEAQRLALSRNWDLLAAAAGVNAATAQKVIAREFPNPTLSLSTSQISLDSHPNATASGNGLWERSYDSVVAINQLFEIGGKRRFRKLSAQAGFEEAKAQFLDAKRTLDLGVAKAYIGAVQAEATARVLQQSAGTLLQEQKLAEVRFTAGEVSAADQEQIDITAERFAASARTAEAAAAQARVALELLLGLPRPQGHTVLREPLEDLVGTPPARNSTSVVAERADVVAADAALRKAEAEVRLQKANRIPDPALAGQYEHQPPDYPNTVGFGLSFPLPLWNRNRGRIEAAEAAQEQARLAYQKAKAQAVADEVTARLVLEEVSARWQKYQQELKPKSSRIRQARAYAYEKGGASLLDMLQAERDDNEVQLAVIQAAADAATAWVTLQAATTTIQPAEVLK